MAGILKKIMTLTAAVLLACGCRAAEDAPEEENYLVKINGETVSAEEFNIYMYETQNSFELLGGEDIWQTDFDGRTAESVARDNALATVTLVKFAGERAREAGIELSEDEASAADALAEEAYESLTDSQRETIGADLELYKKVMRENALYNEVYKYIVSDYVVSEDEFEQYYEQNRDELVKQYEEAYGVENTEDTGDGTAGDEDAVRDFAHYNYEEYMRQLYFQREFDRWEENADIVRNQSLWNAVTLIK